MTQTTRAPSLPSPFPSLPPPPSAIPLDILASLPFLSLLSSLTRFILLFTSFSFLSPLSWSHFLLSSLHPLFPSALPSFPPTHPPSYSSSLFYSSSSPPLLPSLALITNITHVFYPPIAPPFLPVSLPTLPPFLPSHSYALTSLPSPLRLSPQSTLPPSLLPSPCLIIPPFFALPIPPFLPPFSPLPNPPFSLLPIQSFLPLAPTNSPPSSGLTLPP